MKYRFATTTHAELPINRKSVALKGSRGNIQVLGSSAQISAEAEKSDAFLAYEEILRVSENGVVGEVSYPDLGINLPIYHGTSDEVLSKGAGHLYGSFLPVGGPSTHAVLTSHSGLVRARLFTPLLLAKRGQVFTVDVLGQYALADLPQIYSREVACTRELMLGAPLDCPLLEQTNLYLFVCMQEGGDGARDYSE